MNGIISRGISFIQTEGAQYTAFLDKKNVQDYRRERAIYKLNVLEYFIAPHRDEIKEAWRKDTDEEDL
jgi:hypothetical protein